MQEIFVKVIIPIKFRESITYSVPPQLVNDIYRGCWVGVRLRGKEYISVVDEISYETPHFDINKVKAIESIKDLPRVSGGEIDFWKAVANYYLCSPGEVLKSAYNFFFSKSISIPESKSKKESIISIPQLSKNQNNCLQKIRESFVKNRSVLLRGVTGSGKTEIYTHLAMDAIKSGKDVLYLVPEISLSIQLKSRLQSIFGNRLRVFNSKSTAATKRKIFSELKEEYDSTGHNSREGYIILGTRSSIFLPFHNLGLTIIDEEHDSSYKQEDPAPRYNGRDAAIMLSKMRGANIVLGSATPSLETIYNVLSNKYDEVVLDKRFHNSIAPKIEIIDFLQARKLRNTKGNFSQKLINIIDKTLKDGEQVLVFRSHRAYSPVVQCEECSDIPKCPHCNITLSYHKNEHKLKCHYCNYTIQYTGLCKACNNHSLLPKGAGTERIEEELKELFPTASIARYDADTTTSKVRQESILEDFASGKTDILVGTQMITKGFDFEKLTLVVVINADSLLSFQNFRADEKSIQLLSQLCGRGGRRDKQGRMVIQTTQPQHPVFQSIGEGLSHEEKIRQLSERQQFNYPPCCRLIKITLKNRFQERVNSVAKRVAEELSKSITGTVIGPISPQIDRIKNQFVSQLWIKLPRNQSLSSNKEIIFDITNNIYNQEKGYTTISIDVDPQ